MGVDNYTTGAQMNAVGQTIKFPEVQMNGEAEAVSFIHISVFGILIQ